MAIRVVPLRIQMEVGTSVQAILRAPPSPTACFVFAHGAGAGMDHPFMAAMASALAEHGIASLRYQFPFMELGSHRPDRPQVAHAAVRAAVKTAQERFPGTPIFAGGKSYGGRMTSQAQAESALDGVRGLVFVGFPLHPAGKPGVDRAEHLKDIDRPMLFLQGTRDNLAQEDLIKQTVAHLGDRALLHSIVGADHSFHVLVRSGRNDAQVLEELASQAAKWMSSLSK